MGKATAVSWLLLFLKASALLRLAFASINEPGPAQTHYIYWMGEAIWYCTYIPRSASGLYYIFIYTANKSHYIPSSAIYTVQNVTLLHLQNFSLCSHVLNNVANQQPCFRVSIPSYTTPVQQLMHTAVMLLNTLSYCMDVKV